MAGMTWLTLAALLSVASPSAASQTAAAHTALPGVPPSALTGTAWVLTQLAPRGAALTPGRGLRQPTLKVLPGGLVIGHTGCNAFSAWATVKGQSLKITPPKRSGTSNCPDHALSLETDFLNLLQGATRFEISGQTLRIYKAGATFLTFQSAPGGRDVSELQPDVAALTAEWQLTTLTHRGQRVGVPAGSVLTLRETAGGLELRGRAGCNLLFGKATLAGRTLHVGDLGLTMMLCEDMAPEDAVVDIFRAPLTVTRRGQTLTLSNTRGELGLTRLAGDSFDGRDLVGHTFTLRSVDGRPPGKSVGPVTLEFTAEGVVGSDGCNRFRGEVGWQGAQLVAGPLASTRMACPDMAGWPSLTEFLRQRPTAEWRGRTLKLRAQDTVWEFRQRR